MKIKSHILIVPITFLSICILLTYGWIKRNEGGPVPYPINLGDFSAIGSTTINPVTVLNDIKSEKIILQETQPDVPEDPPFIMTIGWSQNDYLEIAKAYHKAIWNDAPNEWQLYKAIFFTGCENTSGKFESADLYYYQGVRIEGQKRYSVRNILIQPEYGYIAWGGDATYPYPVGGWKKIDVENIRSTSAERALALADQEGGDAIRKKVNNICRISVSMWPWGYERNAWKVAYGGNVDIANGEIWIDIK